MKIKKCLNVEYDLTSDEFKVQKQDEVSAKFQAKYPDYLVKVMTFCVADKNLVIHTTENNKSFIGASDKMLAHRPIKEQSFLNMDDEMLKTYEINITKDSPISDYETALDTAQDVADNLFEQDDTKIPVVTVIDYKWGNSPKVLSSSLFTELDENGDTVSLIGQSDSAIEVIAMPTAKIKMLNNGAEFTGKALETDIYIDEIKSLSFEVKGFSHDDNKANLLFGVLRREGKSWNNFALKYDIINSRFGISVNGISYSNKGFSIPNFPYEELNGDVYRKVTVKVSDKVEIYIDDTKVLGVKKSKAFPHDKLVFFGATKNGVLDPLYNCSGTIRNIVVK